MSTVRNFFLLIESNFFLMLRKIVGIKIDYRFLSLVNANATLRTDKKGRIILGKRTAIRSNTELSATNGIISIGDNCFVNKNCMIIAHESIKIGEGTTIGPNVCIYDHDHDGAGGFYAEEILIGKNVWIGASAVILKGVHVGDGAVIGAGAVVTHDVPSGSLAIGVPANIKKQR